MMKRRRLARGAGMASMLLVALSLSTVSVQALSTREIKKTQKAADKALAAGQIEQAVEAYEKILASLPTGDPQRGAALYTVALAHLSPTAKLSDVAVARGHLEELAKLPGQPRRLEVTAIQSLLAELDKAQAENDLRAAELEKQLATSHAEHEEAQASIADESEAADERVKSLEAQLRRARGQLKDTRAELEKKDEALQKLKDALVGRASGSG